MYIYKDIKMAQKHSTKSRIVIITILLPTVRDNWHFVIKCKHSYDCG